MNPFRKRSLNLFVGGQAVPFTSGVESGPQKRSHLEFHSRTRLDAAGLPDQWERSEPWTQESEGAFPLMEAEDGFYRRLSDDASEKRGRALSCWFGLWPRCPEAFRRKRTDAGEKWSTSMRGPAALWHRTWRFAG